MAIDRDSPSFLFGQILQRIEDFEKAVNARLDKGEEQFKEILTQLKDTRIATIKSGNETAVTKANAVTQLECKNCDLRIEVEAMKLSKAKIIGIVVGVISAHRTPVLSQVASVLLKPQWAVLHLRSPDYPGILKPLNQYNVNLHYRTQAAPNSG